MDVCTRPQQDPGFDNQGKKQVGMVDVAVPGEVRIKGEKSKQRKDLPTEVQPRGRKRLTLHQLLLLL